MVDHVHLLLSAPPTLAVSEVVKRLKGATSRWIKDTFPNKGAFAWQDGYGAFTVSASQIDGVRDYIRRQEEHHKTVSFADEYRAFLERHNVAFDERYLFG